MGTSPGIVLHTILEGSKAMLLLGLISFHHEYVTLYEHTTCDRILNSIWLYYDYVALRENTTERSGVRLNNSLLPLNVDL